MFDYTGSATTALALITKFGRTIQHIAITEGAYDVSTSSNTLTETSTDCAGCDFSMKDNAYKSDLVQAGDRYALIGNTITDINVSDKLVIDSVRWNIVNVKKLAPAGTVVLWWVHIRK